MRLLSGRKAPQTDELRLLQEVLRGSALFEGLTDDMIAELVPACRVKAFSQEDISCHCPDASHDAFILTEGVVAVTRKHPDDEHVLDLATQGAVFNVGALMGAAHDYAHSRALGQVQVVALDGVMLQALFHRDPYMGYVVTRTLGQLLSNQMGKLLDHLLHP